MDRLVANHPFVSDLDPERIEEDERINRIERPLLPGRHFIEYGIGHRADQIGRDIDAVKIMQMSHDLARAHAARVHRDDLLIEAGKASLIFGDQLRIEARLPVAGNINHKLAGIGHHRLAAIAVAVVVSLILLPKMIIHLGIQSALGQRLLQIVEQTSLIKGCACRTAGKQLVQKLIGYRWGFAS